MGLTEWHPDSCQCIILYNDQQKYADYIQKCQEHKTLSGESLLTELITHNTQYNTEDKIPDRKLERKRIKALGKPIKKPIQPEADGTCPVGYNLATLNGTDICILIGEEDEHSATLKK